MGDIWSEMPAWNDTPATTRTWVDTYILGDYASLFKDITEDYVLWAIGAWDIFVGIYMFLFPDDVLSWLFGF